GSNTTEPASRLPSSILLAVIQSAGYSTARSRPTAPHASPGKSSTGASSATTPSTIPGPAKPRLALPGPALPGPALPGPALPGPALPGLAAPALPGLVARVPVAPGERTLAVPPFA